jgi:hypothetical protein
MGGRSFGRRPALEERSGTREWRRGQAGVEASGPHSSGAAAPGDAGGRRTVRVVTAGERTGDPLSTCPPSQPRPPSPNPEAQRRPRAGGR